MTEAIIDASALLALLNSEPGAGVVAEVIPEGVISAVNLFEVVAKLSEAGVPEDTVHQVIQPLGLDVVPFDEEQAYRAGLLRMVTIDSGISAGDRACLSLAETLGVTALTADEAWAKLSVGAVVKLIR